MEQETHQAILERVPQELPDPEMARWIETINRHNETGEDGFFHLGWNNDKQLMQFVTLVGHTAISSNQILGYAYQATADEPLQKEGSKLKFKGQRSIIQLEDRLGNFAVVCDDCAELEEYRDAMHFESIHSCEHSDDEYTVNNYAHIMRRLGRKAIVNERLLEFS